MEPLFVWQILVENLKQYAYKNVHELIPMDELAVVGLPMPLASLQIGESFIDPNLHHLQPIDFQVAQQGIILHYVCWCKTFGLIK